MIELLDQQGNDNTVANTARVSMQFDGTWGEIPEDYTICLLYTSPSPRDQRGSRMPSSA